MLVTETRDPDLYEVLSGKNLARQYDLLHDFIEIGLRHGPAAFDKQMLWALNHAAIVGDPGRLGLTFERVAAVDARLLPPEAAADRNPLFRAGSKACMLSHGEPCAAFWRWIAPRR